jgi:hypothetical protein
MLGQEASSDHRSLIFNSVTLTIMVAIAVLLKNEASSLA